MTLIDLAAQAMAKVQGSQWAVLNGAEQQTLRDCVHAVIKAVRQPDVRMTEAGAEIIRKIGPDESDAAHLSDAANTWRFMIDALLDED
ncbi:hypothetical protein [Novosphingobium sp. Leaf2]|uniref:hypothetical protein n=1 Tax=Novosphingobium sp. Leaf2 TaxID=1735670 RepID=UPI0006F431BC|nr:hypothetical protein [Novosphingobium sp. Leaf2]KQM18274.1 hypothetical protein ASE49_08595 [Novosphingobium sp. Leaf2]